MLVAGFDTETTGLNVAEEHIIQVGLVLWDTTAKKKKAKIKFDRIIKPDPLPKLDPKVIEVNGITEEDLLKYGQNPTSVLNKLNVFFTMSEAIIAHNGNLFDRPMYEHNCARYGIEPVKKLWIDTSCDIEFPPAIQTRKLVHLAAEHGFVNPFPHDAISDVLTMLKIADLYDWDRTIEFAKAPTLIVRAETTFQQKELAKKQGFRWDGDNKMWIKSIKLFQLDDCKKAAFDSGFKITVMK